MGRSRHHVPSAPGALRPQNGFTLKHWQIWPIRDNFRSTLGSIVQVGMLSGGWARRKRRRALKQRRTATTGGTPSGQQTTPVDAATRSGPQDTTSAGSSRPQDRRTRKTENSTIQPHSGERVAFAEKTQVSKGKEQQSRKGQGQRKGTNSAEEKKEPEPQQETIETEEQERKKELGRAEDSYRQEHHHIR
ncbi:hypothetical protein NDU88_012257 [Pleurodeles waltl]|uniref:Uncharacterized protein n=1 Tax=Pleurodeles waltl TaxID=8319 RepID=A0AAV7R1F6_PLEWA|nr:hypothetical protein NDU88_012257 [Pleurodeles waltl]